MLFGDLREIKSVLQIHPLDTSEDKTLNFYLEWASGWLEEQTNRQFAYKTRTQLYKGTNSRKMTLRCRPAFPNPVSPYSALQIIYDPMGYFGSAAGSFGGGNPSSVTFTYGVDYCLQIDQDDGGSRCGILWGINRYWEKPQIREQGYLFPFVSDDPGSYQVTYTAGYTVDTLPSPLRAACNLLASAYRYVFPLGMAIGSDSYQERSIGVIHDKKDYLTALMKPHIQSFTNFKW